jgi:hypothetical protein
MKVSDIFQVPFDASVRADNREREQKFRTHSGRPTGYGREHRGTDGWHAMPTFEQKTPSAPLPQERHPSVHAVQAAFDPFANSSSRISVPALISVSALDAPLEAGWY